MNQLRKFFSERRNRRRSILFAVLAVCIVSVTVYLNTYYHADDDAVNAMVRQYAQGQVIAAGPDNLWLGNGEHTETVGIIFYPGGKVEERAYLPLMAACNEYDIFCIMPKMPFRLAVLDINAAEEIRGTYTNIDRWYIGGHSLGGSMAAAYLADHTDEYEGLILLGSYSTEDFSAGDVDVLTIYGSEDEVLNMEKYEKYRANLPADTTEIVLEGGCHAYFGVYGAQDGDGTPTITNEEQIGRTAEAIAAFVYAE